MTSKNPITGDRLVTKPATDDYRENWEKIYGDEMVSTELKPNGKALEDGSIPSISTIPHFLKKQAC